VRRATALRIGRAALGHGLLGHRVVAALRVGDRRGGLIGHELGFGADRALSHRLATAGQKLSRANSYGTTPACSSNTELRLKPRLERRARNLTTNSHETIRSKNYSDK